ncbi:MAG: hypothetical protein J07AB43_02850 [Candidatus Nanosalina sp. J07AB43]|jgi:hypothetical protein|nr:MAG: hypothetical protein J07AB43_02850 [Candidatus Nanosalina sp. J07AB43]
MTNRDTTEEELKSKPDEYDSWSHQEPGLPDWEKYMGLIKEKTEDGDVERLTISINMVDSAYISSTVSVPLENWE